MSNGLRRSRKPPTKGTCYEDIRSQPAQGHRLRHRRGRVNGVVSIDLGSTVVKADITMEAINDLGLKEGTDAMAIIKPAT